MATGKRLNKAYEGIDRTAFYNAEDAVKLVKERAKAKFDETIEVSVNLNVDPRKSEQNVRGTVQLPNGTGKTLRVAVFAKGDRAKEAEAAGADIVGADDLAEKINAGTIEFDRCIATPDMMVVVGKLGKVLGPRGLMPNPKLGTVTTNVAEAVKAAKGGQVEYRTEKAGIVQAGVGKASFTEQALVENIKAFVGAVSRTRPAGVKGAFVKRISVSTTMGPGLKLDIASVASRRLDATVNSAGVGLWAGADGVAGWATIPSCPRLPVPLAQRSCLDRQHETGSPVVSEPSGASGASGTGEPSGRVLRPLSCNRSA